VAKPEVRIYGGARAIFPKTGWRKQRMTITDLNGSDYNGPDHCGRHQAARRKNRGSFFARLDRG